MAEISFPLPDLGEGLIEATVLEWLVAPGDQVEAGQTIATIEAMKMEASITAPSRSTHSTPGSAITHGPIPTSGKMSSNGCSVKGNSRDA